MDIEKRLNEKEAAEFIGHSTHFLRMDRYYRKHKMPCKNIPYRLLGKRVLYRRADLIAWLEKNEQVIIPV